jgi:hypothetical protein
MGRKPERAASDSNSSGRGLEFSPAEIVLIKALVSAQCDKLDGLTSTEIKAFSRGRLTPNVLNTLAKMAALPPDEMVFRVYRATGRIPLGAGVNQPDISYANELAYRVWAQLSTRIVAHEIDWERDELSKVYESWYACFQQIRTLVEQTPVWRDSDQAVAKEVLGLVCDLLNMHARAHLTEWQSRYRHWSDSAGQDQPEVRASLPRQRQNQFPDFQELKRDFDATQRKMRDTSYRLFKVVFPQKSGR